MSRFEFGKFSAIETENGFYIESEFFSPFSNNSFPIFVEVLPDESFKVHDNGFLLNDYGNNEYNISGINMIAASYGFTFKDNLVFQVAKSLEEKTALVGKLLSICYCLDSTYQSMRGDYE